VGFNLAFKALKKEKHLVKGGHCNTDSRMPRPVPIRNYLVIMSAEFRLNLVLIFSAISGTNYINLSTLRI
jgi:hypothetical protein